RLAHREVLLLADRDLVVRRDERELPLAGDRVDHAAGSDGEQRTGRGRHRRATHASKRHVFHISRSRRALSGRRRSDSRRSADYRSGAPRNAASPSRRGRPPRPTFSAPRLQCLAMDKERAPTDFIRQIVANDVAAGKNGGRVQTRFPPEPNGYLHIGHAKAICIDFGIAEEFGGVCYLRFDDTNPDREDIEYVEAIQRDVRWLGFDWGDRLTHASDYFPQLYEFALQLIRDGKAYVDHLSAEEIREYRGT